MTKKSKSLIAVTCTLFALVALLFVIATPSWAQSQEQDSNIFDVNNSAKSLEANNNADLSATRVEMYRLYNQYTGEHFYTSSSSERASNIKAGWKDEGIEWYAPSTSNTPVYRLYNPYTSDHHYTTKKSEYDSLGKSGWKQEGVSWYSVDDGDSTRIPLYRQFNPFASTGTHNYTKDTAERDKLIGLGWKDEGIGWYGYTNKSATIDFSKATVDTKDKVYQGSQWKPSVLIKGLTKDTDYTVTYGANKNVGKGTITITGKGAYSGTKTYTFNITQKTITSVKWSATSFKYNTKEQAPTATAVGLCGSDKASIGVTVTGTHKEVGTYTANAKTISNSNYKLASNIKVTYKIVKADPAYTKPSAIKAGSVQTLGDLSLPTATNGKFTWQDKTTTSVGSAGTSTQFKVTFTPTDTKNYNTIKDIPVTVEVYSVADHTVTFDNQYQGDTPADQISDETGRVLEPTDAGESAGLKLEGWYTDAKCTNDEEHKWDFDKDVAIEDMTLYANWVPSDEADGDAQIYWISPSMEKTTSNAKATSNENYVKEAWNVRKSSTQIKSDVNVLIQGDVAGNETYAEVKAEYEEILKNDDYHLYTAYNGSDAKTDADKYAEFRILEVGEHTGDGSALTFQATHALPTATQMNTEQSNEGGWASSNLRQSLQEDGSIFANFNTAFTDSMIFVDKASTVGGGQESEPATDTETSSDKLWLTSRVEMTGSTLAGYAIEGTQYTYYANLEITDDTTNEALAKKTRSGAIPTSASTTSDFKASWWERSAYVDNSEHFLSVDTTGLTNFNAYATRNLGVVPAFSFGKQKISVKFDVQDHGNEVGIQYVEEGQSLTDPTNEVGEEAGLKLEGWYVNDPDCKTENRFDFENGTISERVTLYANWVAADSGDYQKYWISPAKSEITVNESTGKAETSTNESYVKANWNVKKSSAEIDEDVKVLLKGKVVGNPNYDKVKAEYEEFMNNDNYHLYTVWGGASSSSTDEDAYVEFRILNVGEHDSDQSALTFQATHMLKTAEKMNATDTNTGGWAESALRTSLQSGGNLYSNFSTGFTDAIFPVSKVSTVGGGSATQASVKTSSSSNILWTVSRSELSGTTVDGYKNEGSQYAFYSNKNIRDVSYNDCLIMKTRSGGSPSSATYSKSWWLRSPNTTTAGGFSYVNQNGYPGTEPSVAYEASASLGVVPSFCLGRSGTHTVSFAETDGTPVSGMSSIKVGDSQTFDKPADPAKDQYEFDGWYTDSSLKNEFVFGADGKSLSTITADTTLYAKWSTISGADYWFASPGLTYSSEEEYKSDPNYVSGTDIKKAVISIKNSKAEDHDAVIKQYKNYMTNENVHLYTKWSGTTTDGSGVSQNANSYVEFRIIQVGEHDGDGSGLTFQAVHELPVAQVINQEATNVGGWAKSALRSAFLGEKTGSSKTLNDYFASGLKKDIKKVDKLSNNGANDPDNYTTVQDSFFLLSYSEVTGTSQKFTPAKEGTQYAYFDAKGINATDANDVLTMGTRAGYAPKGAKGNIAAWWLRSPNITNVMNFIRVGETGAPHYSKGADEEYGVVPAFCF